ncbi:CDP-6-deoxy-delta-3,4-glucoseen reductase [Methylobacillus gramineus]|uniref:CDP-6-deoxy-delta-3,4-glucoseen reductase n=1 Tax=Methylobacillus gramineus TaxID=755169 RepID=UPI001CFFFB7B|nr:CDP-6-deoxy-delta-3,4-glucoseen reductase [Methylobacillus gramineus]MCB5185682.1 CDP-6-deoxy-delta-3,4-glucoseen reductase [Methylobacillus gramineus]
MSYQVIIKPSDRVLTVENGDTVLDAAIDAGINLPYGCRNGTCGACKGQVLAGEVNYGDYFESALSEDEKKTGKALFCSAQPLSNLVIECREVAGEGIPPRIMPVRVEKLEKLSHDVMGMTLKLPSNERMQFMAGQYIEFLLKDGRRRAFSLANAPYHDRFLELHMRLVPGGQFTHYVFSEMQEKTILRLEGPFGTFYLREESDSPVIFVAGGTGFAPVKGIIEHALHHGVQRKMILYWGARSKQDIYMHELPLKWQAEHPLFEYIPVLSDPAPEDDWQGRTGLVHHAVLEDHADLSDYQVYCCGAPQMVETAHQDFQAHGLPAHEFFSDAFTFSNPVAKAGTS